MNFRSRTGDINIKIAVGIKKNWLYEYAIFSGEYLMALTIRFDNIRCSKIFIRKDLLIALDLKANLFLV